MSIIVLRYARRRMRIVSQGRLKLRRHSALRCDVTPRYAVTWLFTRKTPSHKTYTCQKNPMTPSFGMQGACFTRNFWLKERRWIPTGVVQPYDHSGNASAESGRKETHFFCITTNQDHIAVHKLRTPWQAWNSQWFHTLLTAQIWHRQTSGCSQNWRRR